MKEGKGLGYSEKEIISGVIKAMKAGSSIRRYFESITGELDEKRFLGILRQYYNVKDSSTFNQFKSHQKVKLTSFCVLWICEIIF